MRKQFSTLVKNFARDDRGASLVEYAILLGIITAAVVVTIGTVGTNIDNIFGNIATSLGTTDTNTQ